MVERAEVPKGAPAKIKKEGPKKKKFCPIGKTEFAREEKTVASNRKKANRKKECQKRVFLSNPAWGPVGEKGGVSSGKCRFIK